MVTELYYFEFREVHFANPLDGFDSICFEKNLLKIREYYILDTFQNFAIVIQS